VLWHICCQHLHTHAHAHTPFTPSSPQLYEELAAEDIVAILYLEAVAVYRAQVELMRIYS